MSIDDHTKQPIDPGLQPVAHHPTPQGGHHVEMMTGGEGDPWYDPEEWEPLRPPLPLPLRVGIVAGGGLLLVLIAWTSARGWWNDRLDPPGPPGIEVAVEIPEGASSDEIARILASENIVASSVVTSYYWRWNEAPIFQAGEYIFRTNSSVEAAQQVLEQGPLSQEFDGVYVVFPEGFTRKQIEARMLDDLPDFDPTELASALDGGTIRSTFQPATTDNLEGFLFPATYPVEAVDSGDEQLLVSTMVSKFDEEARTVGLQQAEQLVGYSPYDVLTIASLIEREAKLPEDQAKIARVIYNRLAQEQNLQIDATVIFALGDSFDFEERGGVVTFEDLEVDSPYNTYKYPGLPPSPIASPGAAAIEAALKPADGDWLYYVVVDQSGRHAFATTLDEHNANIAIAEQNGVR